MIIAFDSSCGMRVKCVVAPRVAYLIGLGLTTEALSLKPYTYALAGEKDHGN